MYSTGASRIGIARSGIAGEGGGVEGTVAGCRGGGSVWSRCWKVTWKALDIVIGYGGFSSPYIPDVLASSLGTVTCTSSTAACEASDPKHDTCLDRRSPSYQ